MPLSRTQTNMCQMPYSLLQTGNERKGSGRNEVFRPSYDLQASCSGNQTFSRWEKERARKIKDRWLKMNDIKTALIKAMESYFNGDIKRINHAHKVTEYAEKLLEPEGGDYSIVIGAAVLHDIGIHEAERKHGSNSGKYQEIEGPPIARRILGELEYVHEQIDEICDIIAHHHSIGPMRHNGNFQILYDADWLVNLGDEYDIRDQAKLSGIIEKVFLTRSGKALASKIYLVGSD